MRFSFKHLLIGLIFSLFAFNAQATMISGASFNGHESADPITFNTLHYGGSADVWRSSQRYGFDSWSDAANWWREQTNVWDVLGQIFGQGTSGWLVDVFEWKLCYFSNCCSVGDNPGQSTQPADPTGPTDTGTPTADVPGPGSGIALLALGLVGLMAWARRRRWRDNGVA